MKVLKFVRAFFPGGTERQFTNLALGLDPSRVAIQFGCLRRSGDLVNEIDARAIPVFNYDVLSFRHPSALRAQFRLARDIRRNGIDIVHTYGLPAHLFAIPAAKLAGARVVASIRDMGIYLSPRERKAQRFLCRFADRILVNASAIKDWLVSDGYETDKITVIPNGIASRGAGVPPAVIERPARSPKIGVIGRIIRKKGLEDFLKAAAIVAKKHPQTQFLIVGDAWIAKGRHTVRDEAYLCELNALVSQLGLQNRVIFTGMRNDVDQILSTLSVSVIPSLSEGLSNAVLESMEAGVPVVATNVGGTAEAVRDGENGLLVRAGDAHAIAEAICRLLDSPPLRARLGDAARRTIHERYSMARVVESTTAIYESLGKTHEPATLHHLSAVR